MLSDRILILQPPSPGYMNVMRDYAGGYGVALKTSRPGYGHEGGSAPYVSSLYAAAVLDRDGYDVGILDCQAEQLSDTDALSRIEQFDPSLIISAVNLPSMKGDLAFLRMAHELQPAAPIITIGTVGKMLYDEVLKAECVAAVIRGDVEVVAPLLVQSMLNGADLSSVPGIAYRQPDSTLCVAPDAQPVSDLNELPMPPYHKLAVNRYREPSWGQDITYMPILDGRGCPYPCGGYCPYPFGFGKRTLFRDPELVVDEVQYLHERFGVEAFIFRSQTFTMNKSHAVGICEEMLRRDLQVRWLCETRLDAVEPGILRLMRSAGCERVHYGLESGDPELFAAVGKPGCDLDGYGYLVEETKKAGMMAKLNVVVGLPGESWHTVRRTIQTIRKLKPDAVMAAIITPYPGTKIFEDALKRGLLLTEDWSEFTGFNPVMRTDHILPQDLPVAQRMIENCLNTTALPVRAFRKALSLVKDTTQRLK